MDFCGIYKITNKNNGKCYIGQSVDIFTRWKKHLSEAYNKDSNAYDSHFIGRLESTGLIVSYLKLLKFVNRVNWTKKRFIILGNLIPMKVGII